MLTKFKEAADEQKVTTVPELEKLYRKQCDSFTNSKDKRLCWYLGAAKDSATNILREVSRPMSANMPPLPTCRKLRKLDSAICSMRYQGGSVQDPIPEEKEKPKPKPKAKPAKKIDFDNLSKLRVKELKAILDGWNEKCTGCAEKEDFISKISSLRSKYDTKTEL